MWLLACALRFPPWSEVIDVISKKSKLKVGRLNILGFEKSEDKRVRTKNSP